MTETEIMTDASDDQTRQSPLQAMTEHIRDSGAAMVLACDIVRGEIEVKVNAGDVALALEVIHKKSYYLSIISFFNAFFFQENVINGVSIIHI